MKLSKTCITVTLMLVVSAAVVIAEPVAQSLSKTEAHRLLRIAHTHAEYHALASYFRSEQSRYEQKAAAEKVEWVRRESAPSAVALKYPRPIDSSRNRYEYFAYEAGQMSKQAAHFEGLESASH